MATGLSPRPCAPLRTSIRCSEEASLARRNTLLRQIPCTAVPADAATDTTRLTTAISSWHVIVSGGGSQGEALDGDGSGRWLLLLLHCLLLLLGCEPIELPLERLVVLLQHVKDARADRGAHALEDARVTLQHRLADVLGVVERREERGNKSLCV